MSTKVFFDDVKKNAESAKILKFFKNLKKKKIFDFEMNYLHENQLL